MGSIRTQNAQNRTEKFITSATRGVLRGNGPGTVDQIYFPETIFMESNYVGLDDADYNWNCRVDLEVFHDVPLSEVFYSLKNRSLDNNDNVRNLPCNYSESSNTSENLM